MSGTLIGHHRRSDGGPATGHVEITPSVAVAKDTVANVLQSGVIIRPLDANGDYRVPVLAFNQAGVVPQGLTYSVVVHVLSGTIGPVNGVQVNEGETVDVTKLTSVDPTAPTYPEAVTSPQFNALKGRVTFVEQDLDDLEGRVIAVENEPAVTWADLPGKPSSFTPSPHHHVVADVDDFAPGTETVLDGINLLVLYNNARI